MQEEGGPENAPRRRSIRQKVDMRTRTLPALSICVVVGAQLCVAPRADAQTREVYFGDTYLHTSWSVDASARGNVTGDPDLAYRYAKGSPVVHPAHGARLRIQRPPDFLAVSDPPWGLP